MVISKFSCDKLAFIMFFHPLPKFLMFKGSIRVLYKEPQCYLPMQIGVLFVLLWFVLVLIGLFSLGFYKLNKPDILYNSHPFFLIRVSKQVDFAKLGWHLEMYFLLCNNKDNHLQYFVHVIKNSIGSKCNPKRAFSLIGL